MTSPFQKNKDGSSSILLGEAVVAVFVLPPALDALDMLLGVLPSPPCVLWLSARQVCLIFRVSEMEPLPNDYLDCGMALQTSGKVLLGPSRLFKAPSFANIGTLRWQDWLQAKGIMAWKQSH